MNTKLIKLVIALLSLILALRLTHFLANYQAYDQGTIVSFETTVQSSPKISIRGQRVSLTAPNDQRVSVQFPLEPLLSYGDRVKLEGRIDYFEAEGNKIAVINYPKLELLQKGSESSLILRFRENIINFYNKNLSPIQSSLMLGIVFGIKQEMPEEFHEGLQRTGLLHITAASGMNITMVGGLLMTLFSLVLRRQLALILTILGILFYALLAGFEPSIVRASIMGILVLVAALLGRQNTSILGLFLAAFFMLFLNPSLIVDIGFQLSFMATLGLIYLRPLFFLKDKVKKIIEKSVIGEDLATTITAQIFTLPILLANFGNYSLASILVNGIVLWTVPILMIIGGIAAVLGIIIEPVGRLISYLSLPLLIYFQAVVEFSSKLGSQSEPGNFSVLIIFGYYLILFAVILFLKQKR